MDYVKLLCNIYKIGFIIVCILFFTSPFAQRMTAPLKAVEIILIPNLLKIVNPNIGKIKKSIFSLIVICFALLFMETYKNINSFLLQGKYFDWVTPYNVPIVTVFNKDDIYKYRNTYLMNLFD